MNNCMGKKMRFARNEIGERARTPEKNVNEFSNASIYPFGVALPGES